MAKSPEKTDWSEPKRDRHGHFLRGGYPVSGPARAKALAEAGKSEDAEGLVSPDAIKAAARRVKREEREEPKTEAKGSDS